MLLHASNVLSRLVSGLGIDEEIKALRDLKWLIQDQYTVIKTVWC